jgi:hypothetical protein
MRAGFQGPLHQRGFPVSSVLAPGLVIYSDAEVYLRAVYEPVGF